MVVGVENVILRSSFVMKAHDFSCGLNIVYELTLFDIQWIIARKSRCAS